MNRKDLFKAYTGDDKYIFVSYNHDDSDVVYDIITDFHNRGYRLWHDNGIPVGDNFVKQLANRVAHCEVFFCFLSPRYIEAEYCMRELHFAQSNHRRIIPIKLVDFKLPETVAFIMAANNWTSLSWFDSTEELVDSLCESAEEFLKPCLDDNLLNTGKAKPEDKKPDNKVEDEGKKHHSSDNDHQNNRHDSDSKDQNESKAENKTFRFLKKYRTVISAIIVAALAFLYFTGVLNGKRQEPAPAVHQTSTAASETTAAPTVPVITEEVKASSAPVETAAPISAVKPEELVSAKQKAIDYLKASIASKCPIVTYETEDPLLSVSSYTYDSAMAAIALISEGEYEEAAKILDALSQGMNADKEFADRFRNAYMAGNAETTPGYWNNEQSQWVQDAYQVGTGTKSTCAAAVALLTYHKVNPNEKYLNTAVKGIDWIISNCQDGNPGFTSGYTGWKNGNAFTDLTYKVTSENLWMVAACSMLADATGESKYVDAASSARQFVTETMYSKADSRFFQGTAEDGITPVTNLVLVDVQTLAELCLKNDSGMDSIAKCHTNEGGYSYDNSSTGGSWLEGTALAALALKEIGETEKAEIALSVIEKNQFQSGSFPEASVPELQTGEKDRTISNRPSVAPCAWFILAVNDFNPFDGV